MVTLWKTYNLFCRFQGKVMQPIWKATIGRIFRGLEANVNTLLVAGLQMGLIVTFTLCPAYAKFYP